MHQGKVMIRLAKHYGDLSAVIIEVVQNSIDSKASHIEISADLSKHSATIRDNGCGMDRDKVTASLQSIGNTMKGEGKYGQFGLGLISPLWLTKNFVVTSCAEPKKDGYLAFTFVKSDIEPQAFVKIPIIMIDDLSFNPEGKIWWRTRVELHGITKDRRASSLVARELANDITVKYGEEIRRRNIKITIKIINADKSTDEIEVVAPEYTGLKLDLFESTMKECGKVKIELFIAQLTRKGREGIITFGTLGNPSRITVKQFINCTPSILNNDVAKALASGIFEGRILCENVELHADRTRFENNDALFALCEVIETWYKKVGKMKVEEAAEQADDNRFQRIGSQVMRFAEQLLRQESFESIAEKITVGTIGQHHVKVPKSSILGPDDAKSIASSGKPFTERDVVKNTTDQDEKNDPIKGRPEHKPGIVYGNHGRRRVEVKGSTGLRFAYVEMEDFRIPYQFDPETGLLEFNMRNPSWGLCQEKDAYLRQYHIIVITTALHCEASKPIPEVEKFAIESITHQTFGIIHGEALLAAQLK